MKDTVYIFINQLWQRTIGYFNTPDKRIYLPYLAVSVILAYYVYHKRANKNGFFSYIFNKRVWLSQSAYVDYLFFVFNALVKILLIIPFLHYGFLITFYVNEALVTHLGYIGSPLNTGIAIILYSLSLAILTDFAVYLLHLAMHKYPILWEFHKIHHSARSMNPFTQYRLHPIELILNNILNIIIFGIVTGVFTYLVSGGINKWMFLGIDVLTLIFFVCGANLRHSHVQLRYFNFLEYIFISPLQHQIHHSQSREHWNKNMGSRLAIWDWMFGTLYLSKDVTRLSFGIGKSENKKYQSFSDNLFKPFKNIAIRLNKTLTTF